MFVRSIDHAVVEEIIALGLRSEISDYAVEYTGSEEIYRDASLGKIGRGKRGVGQAGHVTNADETRIVTNYVSTRRSRPAVTDIPAGTAEDIDIVIIIVGDAVAIVIDQPVAIEVGGRIDTQRERQAVFANAAPDRTSFRTGVNPRRLEGP